MKVDQEKSSGLRMKKRVVLLFIFLFVSAIMFSVLYYIYDRPFYEEYKKYTIYREPAEEALGFETGTPYVNGTEVFMIEKVYKNSSMEKAGAMERDIIIDDKSIGEFFEEIYRARERNYSFVIERNASRITLSVYVPLFEANEYKELDYGNMCLLGVTIPSLVIIAILLFYARLLAKAELNSKKEGETGRNNF